MSEEDTEAQTMLANAVDAGEQGKTTTSAGNRSISTAHTETVSPWDELGSFEDVKKRLEHARTWETRAKANADAAKKLADLEESQKTEQQKLADRLTAAEQELSGYRVREVRAKAARDAGLDADMGQFLTENEPETALAQAKLLAKKLQPAKADLKQGARPAAQQPESPSAWLRRAAGYTTP